MKATDLRLGNLILDGNEVIQVNTRVLKMIESKEAEFDPIPLTEEWLLKFGFELYEEDFFVKTSNGGDVLLMEYLTDSWCASVPTIEFFRAPGNKKEPTKVAYSRISTTMINNNGGFDTVHQLQNLYFALTGEELIIKNN